MKLTQKIQETFQSLKRNFSQGIFMYDRSLAKSQEPRRGLRHTLTKCRIAILP